MVGLKALVGQRYQESLAWASRGDFALRPWNRVRVRENQIRLADIKFSIFVHQLGVGDWLLPRRLVIGGTTVSGFSVKVDRKGANIDSIDGGPEDWPIERESGAEIVQFSSWLQVTRRKERLVLE